MKKIAFASCFIALLASGALAIAAEVGSCKIQVSGDVTMSTEMSQTDRSMDEVPSRRVIAMAATDYWRSDAVIRKILKTLAEVTSSFGNKDKATQAAEVERTVNEQMKKDPRVHVLTINCMNSAVNLNLEPRNGSKYANVPFKANRSRGGRRLRQPNLDLRVAVAQPWHSSQAPSYSAAGRLAPYLGRLLVARTRLGAGGRDVQASQPRG